MAREETRNGYCPMCMQNVQHTRKFASGLLRALDRLSLGLGSLLRFGPWYCYQCERKSIYLPWPDRNAPTFHKSRSRSEFVDDSADNAAQDGSDLTETVGNYLQSDRSLVMQQHRSRRYSQKFRDAAVDRLVSGSTTISQLKSELNLAEADILAWISEYLSRQRSEIARLRKLISAFEKNFPDQVKRAIETHDVADAITPEDIVDGKVLPK